METERENFYRYLCLMIEVVAEVFQCRLQQSYTSIKVQTLQSFLKNTDVSHTIFHLFHPAHLCCWKQNCGKKRAKGFGKQQWNILYNADTRLRCNKNPKDTDEICICCVTPKNVVEADIDISLLSLLLINCCNLEKHETEAVQYFRQMKNDYISHNHTSCMSKSVFDKLWNQATLYIKCLNNTTIYLQKQDKLLYRPMDESLMKTYFEKCLECDQLKFEISAIHDGIQKGNEMMVEVLQRITSLTCLKQEREPDYEENCKSRKRLRQEATKFYVKQKDKTDNCASQLEDTKPLDMYREYISSNLLASNLQTPFSLQMEYTVFTMKGLWKRKGFKEMDKFICGKCSWLFVSLDEFITHKEQCKIRQQENELVKKEYKKHVVTRITVTTEDQDLSTKIEKNWKDKQLDPLHNSMTVEYITTGSVVIWVKVDLLLFLDSQKFYEALDNLVKNIFQMYQVNMPLYCIEVYDISTGYIDHISDEFCCADCKIMCNTLDNFLSHKNTRCFRSTANFKFQKTSCCVMEFGNLDEEKFKSLNKVQSTQTFTNKIREPNVSGDNDIIGTNNLCKGHFKEALTSFRHQLALAKKLKNRPLTAKALDNLGDVYYAIGDYPNALQSYKDCAFLQKQCGNEIAEAREIGKAGDIYMAMKEFSSAVECHKQHLEIAQKLNNSIEVAEAYNKLGIAYHDKKDIRKATTYHKQVLKIALQENNKDLTGKAYAGLGHAARYTKDFEMARSYYKKQLDNAQETKVLLAEGEACYNLGIIYYELQNYNSAIKFHEMHLKIAKNLGDRASVGRALGNIGNAYTALKQYDKAVKYHKQEIALLSELNDRQSEGKTHGNLAVAYQGLGMCEKAILHYITQWNISKELKDTSSEAVALCNLGNYYRSKGDNLFALKYYENYLNLSQELQDSKGEGKACVNLANVHSGLGNHSVEVRYIKQYLSISRELRDKSETASAYCNLGNAYKALHQYTDALKCHKKSLSLMKSMQNVEGTFDVLGYIGDITLKNGDTSKAIKVYEERLHVARQCKNIDLLSTAYGDLGAANRTIGQFEKALNFHTQELSIRQDMSDTKGECRANGNLGHVYMSLGKYPEALICFEEQLEKSKNVYDSALEAHACGNLGIINIKMQCFEVAIDMVKVQLALLEQVCSSNSINEKGRALGNLGDCYEALGDYEESIRCHEQCLATAQQANSLSDQENAYRGLGNAHRSMGNLKQALICNEKRLVVAHQLNNFSAKSSAYSELGCLHSLLGHFEQAISCLQHQLSIAKDIGNSMFEGEAAWGLGVVFQKMGEYDKALEYHQTALYIAMKTENKSCQCRAYGNLGLSHASLRKFNVSIEFLEKQLCIAIEMNDKMTQILAHISLGRVLKAINSHTKAMENLRQGLSIAEQLGHNEDKARISYYLGLSLFDNGEFQESQLHLHRAVDLYEGILRAPKLKSEYMPLLFDLQASCLQVLQRVLVFLGRHNEALVIAERARYASAFIDYLQERHAGVQDLYRDTKASPPITPDLITSIVEKQKALVMFYSVAGDYLYCWLVTPRNGIVKFHAVTMAELEADNETTSRTNVRPCSGSGIKTYSNRQSESVSQQHFGELDDELSRQRNNNLPTSSKYWHIPDANSPLSGLYHNLIEPMEEALETASADYGTETIDLVLVLQEEMYSIPFSMLRKTQSSEWLFERFNIITTSSLLNLENNSEKNEEERPVTESFGAVVVGNPKLLTGSSPHWIFKDIQAAENEARIVGELLTSRPLIGPDATKAAVLHQIEQVGVIHFCTHISWKLSSIVLAPSTDFPSQNRFSSIDFDNSSMDITDVDGQAMSEYLLTAADIYKLKLHAKLVVLSSGYSDQRSDSINSDSVVRLTRALLSAGAECVLYTLWPVPDDASIMLMQSLYTGLKDGNTVTHALHHAIKSVQSTKKYSHPSNWGSWVLVGRDIKLNREIDLVGYAICEILLSSDQCREAMIELHHLIELSLMRIRQGLRKTMYTKYTLLENKVRGISGWKDLLKAVGFRFEARQKDLPPAVLLPQSDPGDRLKLARSSLHELIRLPPSCLSALSKFLSNQDAREANIRAIQFILNQLTSTKANVDIQVNVELWRVSGCHELFASLGLELVEVVRDGVTLRLGKQTVRRHLKYALKSLVTVFDTQNCSKSLSDDLSNSLESLSSSHNGSTSTSNSSNRSPSHISVRCTIKKSNVNPAKMKDVGVMTKIQLTNEGELLERKNSARRSGQEMSKNVTTSLPSRKLLPDIPRRNQALSGADRCIRISTSLEHIYWHNLDSENFKNAFFVKRSLSSSSSSSSCFSDIIQPRKTIPVLNNSPNKPRRSGKKLKKRISFSDSDPSDLDSSYNSRSTYDIIPVTHSYDGFECTFNRNRNIYKGFISRTPSPYANKSGQNKIEFLSETRV